MKHTLLLSMALGFAVPAASGAVNLITNGDFESGDVTRLGESDYAQGGFFSDYLNIRDFWNLTSEGCFAVTTNPADPNHGNAYFPNGGLSSVSNFGDHTTGSGRMMVVNGAGNISQAVWTSAVPITVAAGSYYRFSAWTNTFAESNPYVLSRLRFEISTDGGNEWQGLGTTVSVLNSSSWVNTFVDGVFESPTSVLIRLMNDQPATGGNDFSLDDLYFGVVEPEEAVNPTLWTGKAADSIPEPALGMVMVAAMGGLAVRRRSTGLRKA